MTNRAIASRYARVLLDVAAKDADPRKVEQDLAAFARLMAEHDQLGQVLVNPAIPAARKRDLVNALVERVGGVSAVAGRLLVLLAERDRLGLLPELLEVYRDLLRARDGIVRARVTTASALAPERIRALEESLAAATGQHVAVETAVDPDIIGGIVANVGGTVYDGSVARHLARLRERLTL